MEAIIIAYLMFIQGEFLHAIIGLDENRHDGGQPDEGLTKTFHDRR